MAGGGSLCKLAIGKWYIALSAKSELLEICSIERYLCLKGAPVVKCGVRTPKDTGRPRVPECSRVPRCLSRAASCNQQAQEWALSSVCHMLWTHTIRLLLSVWGALQRAEMGWPSSFPWEDWKGCTQNWQPGDQCLCRDPATSRSVANTYPHPMLKADKSEAWFFLRVYWKSLQSFSSGAGNQGTAIFILILQAAQKAFRGQKSPRATGSSLYWAQHPGKGGASPSGQRHRRISTAGPSPGDQLEHQGNKKFMGHTGLQISRTRGK